MHPFATMLHARAHSLPANCSNSKARLSQSVSISTFSPVFRCGICRIVGLLYFWSLCELCAFRCNHFFQLSCQFKTFHGHGVSSKTERHRFQMPPSHISDTPVVPFPAFPNTILGRISDSLSISLKACNGRFCLFLGGTSDGSDLLSLSTKRCQGGRGRSCGRNASSSSCSAPKSSQSQLGALAMPANRRVGWNQHHRASEVVYTTHHRACEVVIYNLIHVVNHNLIVVNMLSICLGLDVIKAFCQVVIVMPNLMLTPSIHDRTQQFSDC